MEVLLFAFCLSLLLAGCNAEDSKEAERFPLSVFSASAVANAPLPKQSDEATEERSSVAPPSVAFYVTWAPKQDPNGIVECGDTITISVTLQINPGSFQPSSVAVTNILDPYTSLIPSTARSSIGDPVEQTATSPNSFSVSVGSLPSFTVSTVVLTFDAKLTEYFSGALVLARNDVYVKIDSWPTYSNVGKPNVFFTCQQAVFHTPVSDDLDDGDLAAVIVVPVLFGLFLLGLLAFFLLGGRAQRFTGAGPAEARENPDA